MNECFILCSMHFITSKLVSFSLWCLNFQGILTPPAQFALGKICMASEVLWDISESFHKSSVLKFHHSTQPLVSSSDMYWSSWRSLTLRSVNTTPPFTDSHQTVEESRANLETRISLRSNSVGKHLNMPDCLISGRETSSLVYFWEIEPRRPTEDLT